MSNLNSFSGSSQPIPVFSGDFTGQTTVPIDTDSRSQLSPFEFDLTPFNIPQNRVSSLSNVTDMSSEALLQQQSLSYQQLFNMCTQLKHENQTLRTQVVPLKYVNKFPV